MKMESEKLGMVYDVVHDELYHAIKGEGAYLNETKLSPLSNVNVDKAIVSYKCQLGHKK